MFFRDVVLKPPPVSIWACFGLYFRGFGPPSWRQVGASWASNCDLGPLWDVLGQLELILNFNKSMLDSNGDEKLRPGRPGSLPAPFWRPPATILEGLGGPKA